GVGSTTGYGRAGVLELGGSAGLTAAAGFTAASFSPMVGWFVADNLQLSGIIGIHYLNDADASDGATMFNVLIEPSYHLPFSRQVFGFLGIGMGGAHIEEAGFGFSIAPRLGANLLVGRSGILTPSLSYQYTTHDTMKREGGTATFAAVSTALMANIG